MIDILESYLRGLAQRAKKGNSLSSEVEVISGGPQGSVLEPIIFIIFMNDLPNFVISKSFGYAEDYKMVATNSILLQVDAVGIGKWCTRNVMKLIISKFKVLHFKEYTNITLICQPLIHINKAKDFGIVMYQELSCTANAERRCERPLKRSTRSNAT